eukprot:scaffold1594_cov401-Prasinococcus_capsulatus_cf.AAC.52
MAMSQTGDETIHYIAAARRSSRVGLIECTMLVESKCSVWRTSSGRTSCALIAVHSGRSVTKCVWRLSVASAPPPADPLAPVARRT